VCVCCTICKATDAQFAEPQTRILQSNRSVQSTAETSCLPCSVAVALTAIGLTTIGLDACSVALQPPHHCSASKHDCHAQVDDMYVARSVAMLLTMHPSSSHLMSKRCVETAVAARASETRHELASVC